jgi:hypothetical protein
MYTRDVKLIKDYVLNRGPEGVVDVFSTVIASIRTGFKDLTNLSNDIRINKHQSKALWGHKIDSYSGVVELKDELYSMFEESASQQKMLNTVLSIKGLGLAKASFGLQMLGYNLACLDTHNLKRLGYSSSYFNNKKRVEEYVSVVQQKGTEYWWNTWCELIPQTTVNKKHFKTAEEVSYEHVIAVRGD